MSSAEATASSELISSCFTWCVRPDGRTRHYRPMRRRRTVAHGISFTLPVSRSFSRRAISACQAASAPSSIWSSRLSRSDPATAARASGGSASASFRISAASRFIVRFYTTDTHSLDRSEPSLDHRVAERLGAGVPGAGLDAEGGVLLTPGLARASSWRPAPLPLRAPSPVRKCRRGCHGRGRGAPRAASSRGRDPFRRGR